MLPRPASTRPWPKSPIKPSPDRSPLSQRPSARRSVRRSERRHFSLVAQVEQTARSWDHGVSSGPSAKTKNGAEGNASSAPFAFQYHGLSCCDLRSNDPIAAERARIERPFSNCYRCSPCPPPRPPCPPHQGSMMQPDSIVEIMNMEISSVSVFLIFILL